MNFETAEEAVRNITAGWNLGNTFDSCGRTYDKEYSARTYETLWGSPVITKEMIQTVKKAGFDAVRMPVTWDAHADENGNIREEWLARVEEVMNYILDEGMYCIINLHHDSGPHGWLRADRENFEKNRSRYQMIWKNAAERFKNYDDKLMFEGFNEMLDLDTSWSEPKEDSSYGTVNSYNQLFVDTVRETGGNNAERNLVVQTYSGGENNRTLDAFVLPSDSAEGHLIAEVHNYDPQGFCWVEAKGHTLRKNWGGEADEKQIDCLLDRITAFRERIGAPVIIGEYGSEDKDNEEYRAAHASYLVKNARERGIKCFWWDTSGGFGLLDRKNCVMKSGLIVSALTIDS